ncbi:MAG: glutathione S-transferase [Arenibacterium sp.]
MTYTLYIGDQMYSSWSMRGWLMLKAFNLAFNTHKVGLYTGTMATDLAPLAPARLVPCLRLTDGTVVGETLAMAETLAERHPNVGLWPASPSHRATARWLCAEMASGFQALRSECPMQFQRRYKGFIVSDALGDDLERLETLWQHARRVSGTNTDWLFGDYTLADVFFTPVAARIIGYGLPVSDNARTYCDALLGTEPVKEWRREAEKTHYEPEPYPCDVPSDDWPI